MSEFFQQLINGLALGAIYALIALGYTMVYGILRFINFAHGDVFMLGAFAGYFLSPVVNRLLPVQSYVGGAVVLVLSMAICALIGMLIEFLAYRPLRNRPKLTVLITAIGVSLFIEYTCQHRAIFGASPRKFPNLIPDTTWHVSGLVLSTNQVLVFVTTALLLLALTFIVQKTRVGTAMRAVSFNEQAAALLEPVKPPVQRPLELRPDGVVLVHAVDLLLREPVADLVVVAQGVHGRQVGHLGTGVV